MISYDREKQAYIESGTGNSANFKRISPREDYVEIIFHWNWIECKFVGEITSPSPKKKILRITGSSAFEPNRKYWAEFVGSGETLTALLPFATAWLRPEENDTTLVIADDRPKTGYAIDEWARHPTQDQLDKLSMHFRKDRS